MLKEERVLSNLGPPGLIVKFSESEAYRAKTMAQFSLEDVLSILSDGPEKYPRFCDDVEVLAINFATAHPEARRQISTALIGAGLDSLEAE